MATEGKTFKRFLLIAGLFVIPAFLIYLFASAEQVFQQLPYLGDHTVNEKGDTIHYTVPDFTFTDHEGNKVTRESLEGKVIILNTVVNSCPEECPLLLNTFYEYGYKRIVYSKEMEDVVMISHLVPSDSNDVPNPTLIVEDLPSKEIKFDRWKIVTGDYNPIYDMNIDRGDSLGVSNPYRDFNPKNNVVGGRASNSLMLLIDHEGHVRGYYPAVHSSGITEIEKHAALLCIAKRHKNVKIK